MAHGWKGTALRVEIAAHNAHISGGLRELIHDRAEHLIHIFDGITTIRVTVEVEKERRLAEIVANVSHGTPVVGKGAADTLGAAFREAVEHVETQLRRHKDRIRDHRGRGPQPASAPEPADEEEWQPDLGTDETGEGNEAV